MSFSFTSSIYRPMRNAVYDWQDNPKTCAINKYGTARIGFALLAVESAATSAIDMGFGVCLATLHLLSAGKSPEIARAIIPFLTKGSRTLLSRPFTDLVRFINPNANFWSRPHKDMSKRQMAAASKVKIHADGGDGLLTAHVFGKLVAIAKSYESSHPIIAHTIPRLIYILNIPISIICRVIDFAIGIIAAVFAILAIGKSDNLNNIAFRGLVVGAIVADTFYNLTKAINPWAHY